MAESTLVLSRLLPLIETKLRDEVDLVLNADNQVLSLSKKLKMILEVLADAERRLVNVEEYSRVQTWLQSLQDIAYEIEDALEEWELENIKQRLEEESEDAAAASESEPWETKVSSILAAICSCFKHTVKRRGMALDIKQLLKRVDSLAQENENEFKFIRHLGDGDFQTKTQPRNLTSSFVNVSEIYGREGDKKTVMSMLLSDNNPRGGEDGVKVVSIVGAGGAGKTTLAQLVFNEGKVKEHFKGRVKWICVSDPFEEIKIAEAILQVIGSVSPGGSELEPLLQQIARSISRNKFLLVLDDVWMEDDRRWKPLIESLRGCAPGCIILVTTRNKEVARTLGSAHTHILEPLEDTYCHSLLCHIAFQEKDVSERAILDEISWEIAKKCKGLPLTATTIGSLLRRKSREQWQSVLESEMWKLERVRKDIFPLLTLSYAELKPAVRRCFSYCAIFAKDAYLDVDELIRIWMAQGFLSDESDKEMEHVGREYFEELSIRSFFQNFVKDGFGHIVFCQMHDMVHDFAQFLTKNECLVVLEQTNGVANIVSNKDVRHLNTFFQFEDNNLTTHIPSCELENLRSFLYSTPKYVHGRYNLTPNLLNHLQRVRLLILRRCGLQSIPEEIGSLIHIRYLDLSENDRVKELPKTICDLYNLQILGINHCYDLFGLPETINKLINLRHLLNNKVRIDFHIPEGFEKLINLRRLDQFYVTKYSGNKLEWLKNLNQLGGNIFLSIDDNEVDEMDARSADLKKKRSLRGLILNCKEAKFEVIEALQPHPNLQTLSFESLHSPKWLTTLIHLKSLCAAYLTNSSAGDFFQNVGKLPYLEVLDVRYWSLDRLCTISTSSSSSLSSSSTITFPKLKYLSFSDCVVWREWEDIKEQDNDNVILPSLLRLVISECPMLQELPHNLLRKAKSLEDLHVDGCDNLDKRYDRNNSYSDYSKISFIPIIDFRGSIIY